MTIRVVIAEDNALLRDGLARLVSSTEGLQLVGTATDYEELLALVEKSDPDVVVTDIRMPPTGTDEGIRAAAVLRTSHPHIGVIVLSQYVSPAYALSLLSQGSERRGYLLKDRVADVDDLVDAIRVVAAGGAVIDPKVVEQLVASSSRSQSLHSTFSRRGNGSVGGWRRASPTRVAANLCSPERASRSTSTRSSRSCISARNATSIGVSPRF